MAELSFQDILDMPIEDIKEPKALPPGTYTCIVDGQPEYAKVGQNQTECVNFNLKPLQAGSDVDANLLREVLDGANLQDKKIRHRIFLTDDSKHRAKKFLLNDLGLPPSSIRQMVQEAMGKQVLVKLVHQASQDGTTVYHTVNSTAK